MIVVGVTTLSIDNATHALIFEINNALILDSLIKCRPRNMKDLQEQVSKYITLDETLQEATPNKRGRSPPPKRKRDSPPQRRADSPRAYGRPHGRSPPAFKKTGCRDARRDGIEPKAERPFTLLTEPFRTILQIIQEKKILIVWLAPMTKEPRKGKNKY
ncbi:unnamed protein product [Linum trigynum]|uniref:Uncharacterized protein n=1 Tax=Linum trigynum TaxID=586398 RepID=A0AAV2CSI2_9ROSI